MSSVNNPDNKDRVPSHSFKEDVRLQFDRVFEALGNHLSEANGAAVSSSLYLIVLIPVKEDLVDNHWSMV